MSTLIYHSDTVISGKVQSAPSAAKHAAADPSAEQLWNALMEGNQRFVDGKPAPRDVVAQRHTLKKNQHPFVSVLSCSDSRVAPEIIFDQGLGDLFVVRVAGNSADPIGMGSLEYAVENLGTRVIIVLGHQNCGAVTAACSGNKVASPNLKKLIQPIAESCRIAKEQHGAEDLVDFAIKTHVSKTVSDLLARSEILKHGCDAGKLSIVGTYYSLDSGVVTRLPLK
jgi:carbonic anhydrase